MSRKERGRKPLTAAQKELMVKFQKVIAVVMAFAAVVGFVMHDLMGSLLCVFGVAVMLALIHETKKYSTRRGRRK